MFSLLLNFWVETLGFKIREIDFFNVSTNVSINVLTNVLTNVLANVLTYLFFKRMIVEIKLTGVESKIC